MARKLIAPHMKKLSRAYLVIAAFAAVGCILLLFDRSEYDFADAFRSAVECADASSDHCYQLNPGLVQAVHVDQTSSGQEDRVDVATMGSIIHVALLPSAADASLVQAGASVMVEWYLGRVAAVWIRGRAIPSISSPTVHANFAYIGWGLVWLAAFFWAVMLVDRRMIALFAAVRILPAAAEVQAMAAREVILPGGTTGWVVKPRAHQAFLLPLLLAAAALISIKPLENPGSGPLALAGDVLFFGPIVIGFALTLRNSRITAGHDSITRVDLLGRVRSWPLMDIQQAAVIGLRWSDWTVPSLWFIGRDGTELFGATSLDWNLDEVGALCVKLRVPISVGYVTSRPKRLNLARLATRGVLVLITGAFVLISFLPLPPSNS
jgi:hypothetical protein